VCATDWNTEITVYNSGLGSHDLNSEKSKSTKIDLEAAAKKLCFKKNSYNVNNMGKNW